MTAMPGISSILGGKSTSSLLNKAGTDKTKSEGESFLDVLKQAQAAAKSPAQSAATSDAAATAPISAAAGKDADPLWEKFQEFVGNTLFGQTLASMRKTLDKPAYFHGGQTEEIFQQQLDQHLVEHITKASSDGFIRPMFEHFEQQRANIDVQA